MKPFIQVQLHKDNLSDLAKMMARSIIEAFGGTGIFASDPVERQAMAVKEIRALWEPMLRSMDSPTRKEFMRCLRIFMERFRDHGTVEPLPEDRHHVYAAFAAVLQSMGPEWGKELTWEAFTES